MDTKNLKKLRIYIVDDHKLFREGLKLLLSTQDFVHHIYEASNGRDFIENLSFVDCVKNRKNTTQNCCTPFCPR